MQTTVALGRLNAVIWREIKVISKTSQLKNRVIITITNISLYALIHQNDQTFTISLEQLHHKLKMNTTCISSQSHSLFLKKMRLPS